ncbi:hypothetical protein OG21DRAFT_1507244 [Imleria badia]|nr:hypothetical protein OG21DRAFT_1507244 [Imleria badia]
MSTIVASKGVEFSDFHICEDIALNLVPFNDLSIVAGWSNTLHVMGIKEIVLYNEEDIVVGVELVYVLSNQNNSPRIVHGKKTKFPTTIQVAEKERIIAAFVGVDDNKIKSLRFTKTNLDDGNVTTEGYTSTAPNLIYSAAFGEISAFRGTQIRGDEGRLVTLGVQTRHLGPPVKI